jgi:hypothetical protein
MTTAKQVRELFPEERLRQRYGGRKPKSYRLAHNHIMHDDTTPHGERGFRRFWIPPQWIGDGWEKCPCGLIVSLVSNQTACVDVRLAKHFPMLGRMHR